MNKEELQRALECAERCRDMDGMYWWGDVVDFLKAALEAKDEPIQKQIIKIKTIDEPCNQVVALGQMMRDWLQSQIADSNTSVDVGKGFSEFDLWVQCEGKELFITIKEKND